MGLDIYMYEVVDKIDEETTEICNAEKEAEMNDSMRRAFDKFSDYVKEETRPYYDFKKAIEAGLIKESDEPCGMRVSDGEAWFTICEEDGSSYEIKEEDIPRKPVEVISLYGKEVGYQRKCMSDGFFRDIIADCWYLDIKSNVSEKEELKCVITSDEFKKVLSYVDDDECPMNKWEFVEGKHIILFDY